MVWRKIDDANDYLLVQQNSLREFQWQEMVKIQKEIKIKKNSYYWSGPKLEIVALKNVLFTLD